MLLMVIQAILDRRDGLVRWAWLEEYSHAIVSGQQLLTSGTASHAADKALGSRGSPSRRRRFLQADLVRYNGGYAASLVWRALTDAPLDRHQAPPPCCENTGLARVRLRGTPQQRSV